MDSIGFPVRPQKAISYLAPALRNLAEAKGRPPALAEAMANKDLQVFHVRNQKTGQETYIPSASSTHSRTSGRNWERFPLPAKTDSGPDGSAGGRGQVGPRSSITATNWSSDMV